MLSKQLVTNPPSATLSLSPLSTSPHSPLIVHFLNPQPILSKSTSTKHPPSLHTIGYSSTTPTAISSPSSAARSALSVLQSQTLVYTSASQRWKLLAKASAPESSSLIIHSDAGKKFLACLIGSHISRHGGGWLWRTCTHLSRSVGSFFFPVSRRRER